MPPLSVKMKRRLLGCQRRVWWPKWPPAPSTSRIETTDTVCPPCGWVSRQPAEGAGAPAEAGTATRPFRRDEGTNRADSSGIASVGPGKAVRARASPRRVISAYRSGRRASIGKSMKGAEIAARDGLQTLSETLREHAWELAVEAVQEGLLTGTVQRLGELGPLDRIGDIPAFVGELAREIADPQAERFAGSGALLERARAHARNREALGFTPREVLMEFLLLRRVLWRALSREP